MTEIAYTSLLWYLLNNGWMTLCCKIPIIIFSLFAECIISHTAMRRLIILIVVRQCVILLNVAAPSNLPLFFDPKDNMQQQIQCRYNTLTLDYTLRPTLLFSWYWPRLESNPWTYDREPIVLPRLQALFSHHFIFFITFKQARFLYTRLERVACTNTLVNFVSIISNEQSVLNMVPGSVFTTLHFLHNFQMVSVS